MLVIKQLIKSLHLKKDGIMGFISKNSMLELSRNTLDSVYRNLSS
jgi:hypothetical protein